MEYQYVSVIGDDINVFEELIRRFYHILGSVEFNFGNKFMVVGQPDVLRTTVSQNDIYNDIEEALEECQLLHRQYKRRTCFFYFGVEGSHVFKDDYNPLH